MNFKNKFLLRFSVGFSIGMIACTFITSILTTMNINDGKTYFSDPSFVAAIGNELAAFLIQCVVSGLYGGLCFGSVFIYEIEKWSILRVTVTHFLVVILLFSITAFSLRWLSPTDIVSNLIILGVMVIVYFFIWLIQYLTYKKEVKKIREDIEVFREKNVNQPTE